jgi:hypothetical protein
MMLNRAQGLLRTAQGCPEPTDAAVIKIGDDMMRWHGITPADFGLEDPVDFDIPAPQRLAWAGATGAMN